MQSLIVMQGVPGSGKSVVANSIASAIGAKVYSTDDFFYVDGQYVFNFEKLGEYHAMNLFRAKKSLIDGYTVIIDNTNILKWQAAPYIEFAKANGIAVQIIRVDGRFQNLHGVPQEKVNALRAVMENLSELL